MPITAVTVSLSITESQVIGLGFSLGPCHTDRHCRTTMSVVILSADKPYHTFGCCWPTMTGRVARTLVLDLDKYKSLEV